MGCGAKRRWRTCVKSIEKISSEWYDAYALLSPNCVFPMLKRFRFLLHGVIVGVTLLVILSSLNDWVRLVLVIALMAATWLIEQAVQERR